MLNVQEKHLGLVQSSQVGTRLRQEITFSGVALGKGFCWAISQGQLSIEQ